MEKYTLEYVCQKLLDNADYIFDMTKFPHLTFNFCVFGQVDGKFWQVIFECKNILNFSIDSIPTWWWDAWRLDYIHFCLQVGVTKKELEDTVEGRYIKKFYNNPEYTYTVTIEGWPDIKLEVVDFTWELKELSFEESKALRVSWGIED